jgi:hypothetical protein
VPLRIHRDTRRLAEIHIRRQLQEIWNRLKTNLRHRLDLSSNLTELRQANCENEDKMFHGILL